MKKRLWALRMFLAALLSLWCMCATAKVRADEASGLFGTVQLLKADEDTYVVQVTAENDGADFEGTIRFLTNATDGNGGLAFDTKITLPNQGKKQFTLTIPAGNISSNRQGGSGALFFLDESGKTIQKSEFSNLFGSLDTGIGVGILSDSYDKLTYLDMSGEDLYIGGGSGQPISLKELTADTVSSALDGLYFLVIDTFDVATLSADTIDAIENWTRNGGWLILGTGEWVSETLDAFDPDFIGVQYGDVSEPGSENWVVTNVNDPYSSYYFDFTASGIDFSQMAVTELTATGGNYYECYNFPGLCISCDSGSIVVLPFALSEDEMQKAYTYAVSDLYSETMSNADSYSIYYDDSDWSYYVRRALGVLDHANTALDFNWLKLLIVVYVIFVGPILYLILRGMKKRDWYWVAVPSFGVLFVGAVFLFGQNLHVATTNLYSVSVASADGQESTAVDTYFSGYHSGTKEWSVPLTEDYEYAGAVFNDYYSYGTTELSASDYHYRVSCGDGLSIGLKPASNFEDAYLFASGKKAGCGAIETSDLALDFYGVSSGTVTNGTEYDFPYLALLSDDCILVIPDVKAGQTVDIAQAVADGDYEYMTLVGYWDNIYYDFVGYGYGSGGASQNQEMAAALYIGMTQARQFLESGTGQILAVGCVRDYEKATTGKCDETSYGCLYTIAQQEGSDAAN